MRADREFEHTAPPGGANGEVDRLRVFLIDDQSMVREGLKSLIDAQPDMEVVGEAEDGMAAASLVGSAQPNVVVVDVNTPKFSGIETARRLKSMWQRIAVLALTMYEDRSFLRDMLQAGASGYLLKRSSAGELLRAIRVVSTGGVCIDPVLGSAVIESLTRSSLRGDVAGTTLSEREAEVLKRVAEGYANKEIAAQLAISIKTVETYKARSMEKLGLDGRTGIVRYALREGWLRCE